jgi:type IV secretory pathway VirB2 component (pilin)
MFRRNGECCFGGQSCEDAQTLQQVYGRRRGNCSIVLNVILCVLLGSMLIGCMRGQQRLERIVTAAVM